MKDEFFEDGSEARNPEDSPRSGAKRSQAISDDVARELLESYHEGGIENLHSSREAARELAAERLEQIEIEDENLVEHGVNGHGKDAYQRLDEHEAECKRLTLMFSPAIPTWQQFSGLFAHEERELSPNERARRIRLLLGRVEHLLRYELKHGAAEIEQLEVADAGYTAHSLQWSPLRKICFHIELAQQRLSSYAREQTGMSAPEIVDCIRVEALRGKMKAQLREVVTGFFLNHQDAMATARTERNGEGETGGRGENGDGGPHPRPLSRGGNGDCADEIWAALKETRKAPRWHRSTWAAGFGFSSYSKFFRACLLCYGKTPHQLEMELIDEILDEAEELNGNGGHEGHEGKRRENEEGREGEVETVKRE
jgi:hypothetical protein